MFGRHGKKVSKLSYLADAVLQLENKVNEQSADLATIHQLQDTVSRLSAQLETYQQSLGTASGEQAGRADKLMLALEGVQHKLDKSDAWDKAPPDPAFSGLPEDEVRNTIVWPVSPQADLVLTVANPLFADHSVTYLILPRRYAKTVDVPFGDQQITGLCIDWELAPRGLKQAIQTLSEGTDNEVWLSVYRHDPETPEVTVIEMFAMRANPLPSETQQGVCAAALLFDRDVGYRRRISTLSAAGLDIRPAVPKTLPLDASPRSPQA